MQQLLGKKAIVTGGTSGIGKQIALNFAQEGASVIIFGTNRERAEATVQEMKEHQVSESQEFSYRLAHIADTEQVKATVDEILKDWPQVDILVNNAGITRDGLLMKMSEEDWDQVLDVNLKSAFNMTRPLIRAMMKARAGSIINISSVVGVAGNPGQANYCASKAGLIGFTKSLALESASRGIRVNCIAPGFIETPMTDELTEAQKQAIMSKIPMGTLGHVQHIADAAVFFASEKSGYITGQVLIVDGGMVM